MVIPAGTGTGTKTSNTGRYPGSAGIPADPWIEDEISKFDRVDMVFDRYFEFSTKSVTRTKRSGDQGTRYRVVGNTPLPGNWTTFLKSVENKRELNEFLQNALLKRF